LNLHEKKTKIVFCKKGRRRSAHRVVSFNFLGYGFQPRTSATKAGKLFLGYDCAISKESQKKIAKELRSTNFHRWTARSIEEIAEYFIKTKRLAQLLWEVQEMEVESYI